MKTSTRPDSKGTRPFSSKFFKLLSLLALVYFSNAPAEDHTLLRSVLFPKNWKPVHEKPEFGTNLFPGSTSNTAGDPYVAGYSDTPKFLHDFSYAGYHYGNDPIPPEKEADCVERAQKEGLRLHDVVKDYGCDPNEIPTKGGNDCRSKIQKAIDDLGTGGGVVYFPPGEYRLTRGSDYYKSFIRVRQSNITLCGAGPDKTFIKLDPYLNGSFSDMVDGISILYMPSVSPYDGWEADLATSTAIRTNLLYPTRVLPVSSVTGFKVGDAVVVRGTYTQDFLREHQMIATYGVDSTWEEGRDVAYLFRRTILGIDESRREITLDVPTRYRIRTTDLPKISKVKSTGLKEVGLENLSFGMVRHPAPWVDECTDSGCAFSKIDKNYALRFKNVQDSWIYKVHTYMPEENRGKPQSDSRQGSYNIEFLNFGMNLEFARNVTVKDIALRGQQANDGGGTGYALSVDAANEVLLDTGFFDMVKKYYSINANYPSSGVVFRNMIGRRQVGAASPSDFHGRMSQAVLQENISVGDGFLEASVRPFDSEDGHGATESVFWNIEGTKKPDIDPAFISWDLDNNRDGRTDSIEDGQPIVVSNQFRQGYIVGTHGVHSHVITAAMPNRMFARNTDPWKPMVLPRDHAEFIGYDPKTQQLDPPSLYQAQLNLRLCGDQSVDCRSPQLPPIEPTPEPTTSPTPTPSSTATPTPTPTPTPTLPSTGNELILDNGSAGSSGTGQWSASSGNASYESASIISKTAGDTYEFNAQMKGRFKVYAWWTSQCGTAACTTRSTQVPYEIFYSGGSSSVVMVNQTINGGTFQLLGTYDFDGNARVVIKSVGGGLSTNADAIRFVRVLPVPTGVVVDPASIKETEAKISFSTPVHAISTLEYGTSTQYGTQVPISAAWAIIHSKTLTGLKDATTYHFRIRAQDIDGREVVSNDYSFTTKVKPRPTVTMDDGAPGTSFTNSWSVSAGTGAYGARSLYNKTAGSTYRFSVSNLSGKYRVHAWWTAYASRASRVKVEIRHAAGTATVYVNQQVSGGKFNALGDFTFTGTGSVTIYTSDQTGASTCADAVQWVPVP